MKTAAVRAVLLLGALYFAVGILFGEFAGRATSHQMRDAWRWAAWIVSAIAFGAHIVYEQVRLRALPKTAALHVASAAGLGAFGLAAAANVHGWTLSPPHYSLLLTLSLAIWPIMTALPAFVVALAGAVLLARARRSV